MCYTGWGWRRESQRRHCWARDERNAHGAHEDGDDAREQIQYEQARDGAGLSIWQVLGLGLSGDQSERGEIG